MRIALLYSERAGNGVALSRIREALDAHGHELVCVVKKHPEAFRLLDRSCDLVVAAGGDGTVSAAARALTFTGVPLAILPLGTANNIARSLGLAGPVDQLIARWREGQQRPIDLGVVKGSWGERRFVEAVGTGLVPSGINAMQAQRSAGKRPPASKVPDALRKYRDVLADLQPRAGSVTADGDTAHGEYLLVEVLNTCAVGPNLQLSPEATPSDGYLSLVTATGDQRDELAAYLLEPVPEGAAGLPSRPAHAVEIRGWERVHIDDQVLVWPPDEPVLISVDPSALHVLV